MQQGKTASVLHQYLLQLWNDNLFAFFDPRPCEDNSRFFFFKKIPQLANTFVCSRWQQVHHGNCPSPAQKKKWLPKRTDSGGCVLCKWVHRRQLSIDVAEEDWQRQCATEKRDLSLLLSWHTFISDHASPLEKPIRRNVPAFIIYTNTQKATTKQTADIRHHACHNFARQIVGHEVITVFNVPNPDWEVSLNLCDK